MAADLVKKNSFLDALYMLSTAWDEAPGESIRN